MYDFRNTLCVSIVLGFLSTLSACAGCEPDTPPPLPDDSSPPVIAPEQDGGLPDIAKIIVSPEVNQCFTEELAWFRVYSENADGERDDVTGEAQWVVRDPEIAAVKAAGVFYCSLAGVTEIEVSYRGHQATVTLTALAPEEGVIALTIDPDHISVPVGFSHPIHAVAFYSDGSARNVSALALWQIQDQDMLAIETLVPDEPQVRALEEGLTNLTALFGGFTAESSVTILPADLISIELIPAQGSVPEGSPLQMTALGVFSDGSPIDITESVDWSSAEEEILVVSNTSGSKGLVTGIQEGATQVNVIHSENSLEQTTTVDVTSVNIDALEITPAFLQLPVGTSIALSASAILTDDVVIDVTEEASWELDNPDLAFITEGELIPLALEGVLAGTTTLRVEYAGLSREAPVVLTDAALLHVELLPLDWSVPMGTEQQFYFFGTYTDGVRLDLTEQATWGTTQPEVAYSSISQPGLFSGLSVGTTTISATFEGFSEETFLDVTDAELVNIEIYPPLMTVPEGEDFQFEAIAVFSDDTQQSVTHDAQWFSEDESIAVISNAFEQRGMVTGIGAGLTEISVSYGEQTDTAALTVSDAVVEQVIITPIWVVVHPGRTQQARAYAQYSNGITHEVTEQAAWSVVNPYIAQASNQNGNRGVITGLAPGYTDVYAHYAGQYGIRHVIVPEEDYDQITIYPKEPVLVPGVSEQLVLVGTYDDYPFFYQDLTGDAFWSSDFEERVTVDNYPFGAGRITAHDSGVVTISATFGSLSDSVTFNVKSREMTEMNLSPPNPVLPVDAIRAMVSLATYEDDTVFDVTGDTSFTSSDPSVVTFLEFYHGYFVGLQEGVATITATLGDFTAETTVTVTDLIPEDIFIAPVEPLINHYDTTQFYVTALYGDGTTGDITYLCTWMSSDAFILLVLDEPYAKGWAYGQNLGTATVSVDCAGQTAETVVTVH
jgi:trimeric autotransporter adhesin